MMHVYYTGEVLIVNIQNVTEGGQSHLRVRLQCESMDLAAELIQDLVRYFKLDELQSEADFPADLQAFEEVSELWLFDGWIICFLLFGHFFRTIAL